MKPTFVLRSVFSFVALLAMSTSLCRADTLGYSEVNYDRFQPNFYGQGFHAGDFLIKPECNITESADDNIYLSQSDTVSDLVTRVKPIIAGQTDWATNALNFKFGTELGRYLTHVSENYQDMDAELGGRLDISRGLYLTATTQYQDEHEYRGLPNSDEGITPNQYHEMIGRLALTRDITRITTTVGADVSRITYDNNTTPEGVPINNSLEDFVEYGADIKPGYEFAPGSTIFTRARVNNVKYDQAGEDPEINDRNSQGYAVDIGASFNPDDKLKGEGYIGYLKEIYDNPAFTNISGLDYKIAVAWQATPLTKLQLDGARSLIQTAFVEGSPGGLESTLNFSVDHQLLRSLVLQFRASYISDDYKDVGLTDTITGASIGAKYYLNEHVALKGDYQYTHQTSTAAGGDYNDNIFMLGLVFGM